VHTYQALLSWSGTTAVGYEAYDRSHTISSPPAGQHLALSGDPAFGGNAGLLNPEQLLVQAAASCQLLSFLAVCARARIDVLTYDDDAEGVMPEGERPMRLTRIVLRPTITVAEGPTEERLHKLCHIAHEECFIANSLKTGVVVEPTVQFTSTRGDGDRRFSG